MVPALFAQTILELKPVTALPGSWNLQVNVPSGTLFTVQSSPDLSEWSDLVTDQVGTGEPQTVSLTGITGGGRRFFRLAGPSEPGVYTLEPRTALPDEAARGRMLYISTGQSLAFGGEGLPLLSKTQPYSNLTFGGGPRAFSTQWGTAAPLVEFDGSAPAVDWWDGTNRGETPCSGACNGWMYLANKWDKLDHTATGYHWFAFTNGRGDKLSSLLPGTRPYQELYLPMLAASKSLADAAALRTAVYTIAFRQGESDSTGKISQAEYTGNLDIFRNAALTDAAASTGQAFKPLFIAWQPQVATITNPNIALAMWEASRKSDDMVLAGPEYYFPSKVGLYFTAGGYRTAGRYDAKISWLWFHEKKRWRPLEPVSCTVKAAVVNIRYRVPMPPLRIDTTTIGEVEQKGFHVKDADSAANPITVTAVAIEGPDGIRLTCSRAVDAATYEIRYGLDHNRPASPMTPLASSGAGCVRDSDNFEIEGETLPNWCVQFSLNPSTFQN